MEALTKKIRMIHRSKRKQVAQAAALQLEAVVLVDSLAVRMQIRSLQLVAEVRRKEWLLPEKRRQRRRFSLVRMPKAKSKRINLNSRRRLRSLDSVAIIKDSKLMPTSNRSLRVCSGVHPLSLKEEASLAVPPIILLHQLLLEAYLVRLHLQVEVGSLEANQMLLLLQQEELRAVSLVAVAR